MLLIVNSVNTKRGRSRKHDKRSRSDKASSTQQLNHSIATLKPQSNGPSYSRTVISTLAVDGWAVAFGAAIRGLGGTAARPGPSSLYQM